MTPTSGLVLAHAFGKRYELPIPLLAFVLGGAAVVLVSFLLVRPRRLRPEGERSADVPDFRRLSPVGAAVSVGGLVLGILAGVAGSQQVAENILPTLFWLIAWIAVPLSCGLVGDWTQPINPFANLARLADRPGLREALLGGPEVLPWPDWLGWWPAVVLFFLTACGELIFNLTLTVPATTAVALMAYAILSATSGLVFGRSWVERGELFTVLYSTWGRLGFFRFGARGRRGFAGGLEPGFSEHPSRIAFVLLLLISVNFDGLLATPGWIRLEHVFPGSLVLHPQRLEAFRTISLLVLGMTIALVFGAFAAAATKVGRRAAGFRASLAGLLPSLLPIAFGYLFAHNIEYLLVNAQLLAPLVGNPLGTSSWALHLPYPFNDTFEPSHTFLPSAFYWYFSVVVIVTAHVGAVVLAHRHLQTVSADERHARRAEYPWLVAMIGYTMLSLWLLAQPLATGG
ncbi:MAG TPA: hypothetical protein VNG13_09500 [Mycobacteriales bacterium]|nr:hypothetical protein [Mycobacteriales bacterium]